MQFYCVWYDICCSSSLLGYRLCVHVCSVVQTMVCYDYKFKRVTSLMPT